MKRESILVSALLLLGLLSCIFTNSNVALGDEQSVSTPNMDMPTTQTSTPNMNMPTAITKPNMDMPDPSPKPLKTTDNTSQLANQTGNESDNLTTSTKQTDGPMDVSGKLAVSFNDTSARSMDLTLWSLTESSRIIGTGTIIEGSSTVSVTAMGTVTKDELKLSIKSATSESINEFYDKCDLDLFVTDKTQPNMLSGTYILQSGSTVFGSGNATAIKH